jgi:hypothetical protein
MSSTCFWLRSQQLASLELFHQPHANPAPRFGDKADPLPFEGNFERLLFIWIVLAADDYAVAHPARRYSRR